MDESEEGWEDASVESKAEYLFRRSRLQHKALTSIRQELASLRTEVDALSLRAFQGVHNLDARVKVLEGVAESDYGRYDIDPVTNRVTINGRTYIPLEEYEANLADEVRKARLEGYASGKKMAYTALVGMLTEKYGQLAKEERS